jgi:hypothetical protein
VLKRERLIEGRRNPRDGRSTIYSLDIADVNKVRVVFTQLADLGHNPALLIQSLVNIQNLEERASLWSC